jgi:hypothetical protein
MKTLFCFILFTFCSTVLSAQFGLPPGFDIKAFQQTEREVIWMLECDTAQQLVEKADATVAAQTLICIQNTKNTGWQVFAGKLDSNGLFKQVRYTISEKGKVEKQTRTGDTTLCDAMARALWHAKQLSQKYHRPEAKRFYVRSNTDLSIQVNAFTEMQSSARIEYDDECNWWFSANGTKLVTSKIIRHGIVNTDIQNGTPRFQTKEKMPTAGIMYNIYKFRFPVAEVEYRTGISTCHYKASEMLRTWEHEAKEKKK